MVDTSKAAPQLAAALDDGWRAIVDALQDPLLIMDRSGMVLKVNESFERVFGWTSAEGPFVPPHPWWPDSVEQLEEHENMAEMMATLLSGKQVAAEIQLRRRNGSAVWASCRGTVVHGADADQSAIVLTLRDITRERGSRARRLTAVRVAADLGNATDLEHVLAIAVLGFEVLFDGTACLRVPNADPDTVVTVSGELSLDQLPEPARTALTEGLVPEAELSRQNAGESRRGILVRSGASGCLVWIQFGTPRRVPVDELIVGDLLVHAVDLAVDRIMAATTFAERQEHLQRALESHRIIGQAIGILVERHRVTPNEAFGMLREASQTRNLKLRDIANRLIETGLEPHDA